VGQSKSAGGGQKRVGANTIGTAIKRMPGAKTLTATLPPQAIIRDKETWISNDYTSFGTTE